jgi:hypothetical protein
VTKYLVWDLFAQCLDLLSVFGQTVMILKFEILQRSQIFHQSFHFAASLAKAVPIASASPQTIANTALESQSADNALVYSDATFGFVHSLHQSFPCCAATRRTNCSLTNTPGALHKRP